MALATADQVGVELGRPPVSQAETDQWKAWLDRVERSIVRGFKRAGLDLTNEIAAASVDEADVADVEVAAVVRKVQNPTWGETSVTRSVDDTSVTTRREGGDAADPLALLPDDWDLLLPTPSTGASSTRLGFQPDTHPGFCS